MLKLLTLFCISLNSKQVFAIVGGKNAKVPPFDDPVVFVNHVGRYSRVEGYFNPATSLYTFRGIRYADPPTRENRFLRPRLKRLIGDVDARKNAPPCPQPDYYDERKIIGNEDCLALNIFTPQMPDETTGLPVILWIHGGGYRYGSAAQYGAEPIIQDKVIFVPIQYRLGTLGILGDGSKEFGGNVAMFDMHAALQWISEYISFFGGDKKKIKVVGHGSGASSAMFLATSPMGRSSVDGVIAMSGSSLNQFAYDKESKNTTEEIAKIHNCPHDSEIELVKCLRSKSIEEIIQKDSELQIERLQEQNLIKAMSGMVTFSPSIEGQDDDRGLPGLIVDKPENSLNEIKVKIPLLIGTTKHETANGIDQNEIKRKFQTFTSFLKSSANTLKFNNLLNATKQVSNVLSQAVKLPSLNDYFTFPDNLSPEKILNKLIDATTDVFFNVPCVLAANLWGKISPSFFYQFEYSGSLQSSGRYFLKPLPLVSKQQNAKGLVAHGDDLGFLFDIYDIFGNRINNTELKTQADQEVRKNFIKLITDFAYVNATQTQLTFNNQVLQSFRGDAASFIKISDKMTVDHDFRFCQLSMLGAPLKATQQISCEFLSEHLKKIPLMPTANEVLTGGGKKLGIFG